MPATAAPTRRAGPLPPRKIYFCQPYSSASYGLISPKLFGSPLTPRIDSDSIVKEKDNSIKMDKHLRTYETVLHNQS